MLLSGPSCRHPSLLRFTAGVAVLLFVVAIHGCVPELEVRLNKVVLGSRPPSPPSASFAGNMALRRPDVGSAPATAGSVDFFAGSSHATAGSVDFFAGSAQAQVRTSFFDFVRRGSRAPRACGCGGSTSVTTPVTPRRLLHLTTVLSSLAPIGLVHTCGGLVCRCADLLVEPTSTPSDKTMLGLPCLSLSPDLGEVSHYLLHAVATTHQWPAMIFVAGLLPCWSQSVCSLQGFGTSECGAVFFTFAGFPDLIRHKTASGCSTNSVVAYRALVLKDEDRHGCFSRSESKPATWPPFGIPPRGAGLAYHLRPGENHTNSTSPTILLHFGFTALDQPMPSLGPSVFLRLLVPLVLVISLILRSLNRRTRCRVYVSKGIQSLSMYLCFLL